jgi:pimeloyl-ACP methyl ester carboxylesterase
VRAGDRSKPPILFLHGVGQSYLSFESQYESSLVEDFQVVAFDLRGHGNSGKPWDAAAYTDSKSWADDVAAVIEALELDRPILVGWSYGTLVVSDYLRHYGTGRLRGIVLTGALGGFTEPPPPPPPEMAASMADYARRITGPDLAERLVAAREFSRMLTVRPMGDAWYERAMQVSLMMPGYVRRHLFARNLDNRALVPLLDVPLLLIAGGKDGGMPEAQARALADRVPTAVLEVYPESGHSPFVEEPERFNADLSRFARAAFGDGTASATGRVPLETRR